MNPPSVGCQYLKLVAVPDDFPTYVVSLLFSGNSVTSLGAGVTFPAGLTHLRHLNMSYGDVPLDHLDRDAFITTPTLWTLRLTWNRIRRIANNSFRGLAELRELDLSNNALRNVAPDTFASCRIVSGVGTLDLAANLIGGAIDPRAFRAFAVLRLILDRNRLAALDDDSLLPLNSSLEALYVRHNEPRPANGFAVSARAFERLTSLRSLSLHNSSLTVGAQTFVSGLPVRLASLDVGRNPTSSFDFSSLPRGLVELNASSIATPTDNSMPAPNDIIRRLDLSSCELTSVLGTDRTGQFTVSDAISGYTALRDLDLSKNRINKFPTFNSTSLKQLEVIKLDG